MEQFACVCLFPCWVLCRGWGWKQRGKAEKEKVTVGTPLQRSWETAHICLQQRKIHKGVLQTLPANRGGWICSGTCGYTVALGELMNRWTARGLKEPVIAERRGFSLALCVWEGCCCSLAMST